MLTALLDTCVLWPGLQRDFLLSLAIEGCYRPAWSEAVLGELEFHETEKLVRRGGSPTVAMERASALIRRMRVAFADSIVTGWEPFEGTFGLPDPDDEHVVAAALVGGAATIVTLNLKDFPAPQLPVPLVAVAPASFADALTEDHPEAAGRAIARMAARTGRHGPSRSPDEIVSILCTRYGMQGVAALRGEG